MESFRNIYKNGGVAAFWRGWQPKVVESFLKGGILLFAKESIIRTSLGLGMSEVYAGLIGGFGGGVAQVRTMKFLNNESFHEYYTSYVLYPGYRSRSMHFLGHSGCDGRQIHIDSR
jgi:hypothetical protein